jgi:hypothetical protein
MKKLAFLLIFFTSLSSSKAQESLESALLSELNLYRIRMSNTEGLGNLCKVKCDADLNEIAKHHATYLEKCNDSNIRDRSHNEIFNFPGFIEKTFSMRASSVQMKNESKMVVSEIQFQSFSAPKGTSNREIAKKIILGFDGSKDHKESMVKEFDPSTESPIVGISIVSKEGSVPGYVDYSVVIDFGVIIK